MKVIIVTPPALEPVSLAELKIHLRVDSETFAGDVISTQSIPPGSHAIADNYTVHVGAAVEVINTHAIVNLIVGSVVLVGAGTIDCKIQESDDNIIWTDWATGAFATVSGATDFTTFEKAYTGTRRYIRTVAKVLVGACDFSTEVVTNSAITAEDSLLVSILQGAREVVEDECRRQLMLATWDYYLQSWPKGNAIRLPFGNLVSVTSIKWKDTAGTESILTLTTDYLVETNGEGVGRICLPYAGAWPSGTLYPSNPIVVRFVAGYASAAAVPSKIKSAILMIATDLWANRENQTFTNSGQKYEINPTVQRLLYNAKLWEEF